MGLRAYRPLVGKVAVVTGAAGVLCSVMARSLLKAGAKVALLGRTLSKLEVLKEELAKEGLPQVLALEADVLDRASLEEARSKVLAAWGHLDVLVNGAGGNDPRGTTPAEQCEPDTERAKGFFGMDMEGFEYVNRLNMIGTILPSQVFGECLAESRGCIVNLSSMAAFQPLTKVGAYGAAKAAVENFTKWLATHLAPLGVRVNAIAPGFFITNQNRFLMLEQDGATPTARGGKVLAKTPMHRFGEPEDLCGALKFLVSSGAGFVTGITIPVDGGFLAYSGV
ncbi:SDR family oxidoreductase [Akkermansia glycaniphila]|uniref:SDR family oxidoreductase n=1 Tax=Akkermansia glycaniphila TaxID=1679444 RepID=UPI0031B84364